MPNRHYDPQVRRLGVAKLARGQKPGTVRRHLLGLTSSSSLYRWKRLKALHGVIDFRYNRKASKGPARRLSLDDVVYAASVLSRRPRTTLIALQAHLLVRRGVNCSVRTLRRSLTRHGLTYKAVTTNARERTIEREAAFLAQLAQYRPEQLIFLDETHFDQRTLMQRRGWSPKGTPAVVRQPFERGKGFSAMGLMSVGGLLGVPIVEGAYKVPALLEVLENYVFPVAAPFPDPLSVIVMDGPTLHRSPRVKEAIARHGMKVLYTPPYNPRYMPLEPFFGTVKNRLRQEPLSAAQAAGGYPALIAKTFTEVVPDGATAERFIKACIGDDEA